MNNVALNHTRSCSVTASAGSGKTHLLVSRIVRLLLAGTAPGGILALTFTRKAAAEMRARVNERLRRLAYGDETALASELATLELEPNRELHERARQLYEEQLYTPYPLRAMTLHAFCQDLLSRFALEAGVAPGFTLVETESQLLERAWQRLVHELTAAPDAPAARALERLIALGESDWDLRQIVMGFYARRSDWWAYTEDVADPVTHAGTRLREALGITTTQDPVAELDAEAYTFELRILLHWLQQIQDTRWIKAETLEPGLILHGDARYQALCKALLKKDGEPYELVLPKAKKLSSAEEGHIRQTHAEVLAKLLDVRERRNRLFCLQRSEAAYALGAAALTALDAELEQDRALTFADLEWRTCRLLKSADQAEWVRYKLDQKIDHVLVDEFQDTSPTQWRLLLPLLEEMAAGETGRARSAFIVGDAKQSIYGFRRANPELLAEATDWMRQKLAAAEHPLNESWRSSPAIIDFLNRLFALPELGAAIGFVPHDTHRKQDPGCVELAPLIRYEKAEVAARDGLRNPLTHPREVAEDRRAAEEGGQVASRIRALIDERVEIITPDGRRRAIDYGDILILARKRRHLHLLEHELIKAGIPFDGAARGTLLETAEGRDLTALLRFLNSPQRDLDLAHALRSPLFAVTDEDLVTLASAARSSGGNWLAALNRLANSGHAGPALTRAARLLERWLAFARSLPAHDLLDRIYSEGDAAARYESALPAAARARARANLGAFIQLALETDHGRYPTLARLLEYLDGLAASDEDAPDEAPPPSEGQVRVMTIHAAKGLEAPAVFLVNCGSVQTARSALWQVEWPHGAERPTHFMLNGHKDERGALSAKLLEAQARREAREELNLLYVAITRARQFLFISGFEPGNQGQRSSWHDYALDALETMESGTDVALPGRPQGALSYGAGKLRSGAPRGPAPAATADDPRLRQPLQAEFTPPVRPSERAEDVVDDPAASRRGTAIHFLLQKLTATQPPSPTELERMLAAQLGGVDKKEFAQWLAEAHAVQAAPTLRAFYDPARIRRAWNEAPISYDGVAGVIDRLVDDGDTLWVLDYKTHRQPDAVALVDMYRPQLLGYVEGVRKLFPGQPVRAGLVLTATQLWVEL